MDETVVQVLCVIHLVIDTTLSRIHEFLQRQSTYVGLLLERAPYVLFAVNDCKELHMTFAVPRALCGWELFTQNSIWIYILISCWKITKGTYCAGKLNGLFNFKSKINTLNIFSALKKREIGSCWFKNENNSLL